MKRALAIGLVLCMFGVMGAAQLTSLTGDWSLTFRVLPGVELRSSVLNLKTTLNGWTITSKSTFGDTDQVASGTQIGFTEQAFGLSGVFGPFSITSNVAFNAGVTKVRCWECDGAGNWVPTDYVVIPPAYKSADFATSLDFAGIKLDLKVAHWAYPYKCPWPCTQTGSYMLYTVGLTVPPATLEVTFEDCCTGIMFGSATLTLTDVGLCCGITYDFELYFTKEKGVEYFLFEIADLFDFCCGISFDLSVEFGVDYKIVTLTPKFAGFGEGCVTIYADVIGWQQFQFAGLEIYGFKLNCPLGDCSFIEFMTVLAEPPVDDATCSQPSWYEGAGFRTNEYEYIKAKFCGPGCCGGTYSVTATAYFAKPGTIQGGLFDLSRLMFSASIPVMSNLSFSITAGLPMDPDVVVASGLSAGQFLLDLGWKFTF
ncbi:hypothetical protein H5T53_03860 [Candidatus Bipolaricaulota bacterium]|nr:hypothetical protein [Candidatus Bipolaricaulota bacterium]